MTLLLVLFSATLAHGDPTTQPASAQSTVSAKGFVLQRDLQYVPGGDPAQRLDLYLPETPSDKPLPLLIWIHGGGWLGGSKSGGPGAGMVHHGYAAASIEYRFSNKAVFPAQIQDCQAAIRWLRANSAKYNIDPNRIGVWGASAGGHLAALVGTSGGKKAFAPIGGNEDQSDQVQAVIDLFGPTDFNTVMDQAAADKDIKNIFKFNTPKDPYSCLIGVHMGENKEKCDAASPAHFVSKDVPPTLILHGTADTLVPYAQSVEFFDLLQKAGVDVTLQKFPGSGHGGPAFALPAVQKLMTAFFDKHLKGADVTIEALPDSQVTVSSKK